MSDRKFNVAVVGATGAVGTEVVKVLAERAFPIAELRLFASERSAGSSVGYGDREVEVELLDEDVFAGIDLAFFCAGGEVSARFVPIATEAGAIVIDKSSVFRMDPDVPLVVPEVNAADIAERGRGIIASPNCTTIPMVVALKPLMDEAGLERLVASSYQAVSGAGKQGVDTLSMETVNVMNMRAPRTDADGPSVFPHRIAFNCIPQVDSFLADGSTKEEVKVIAESRRVLHHEELPVSVTCVRVPTFYGHGVALTFETTEKLEAEDARRLLRGAPGVILADGGEAMPYPTPADVGGTDAVFVGRVRNDPMVPCGLQLWVAADNVRKGAAVNAVQIAEIAAREL